METWENNDAHPADVEEGSPPSPATTSSSSKSSGIAVFFLEHFKNIYSVCLVLFATVIVHASIFSEQTVGVKENGIPAVAAFFVIWFLIVWLAVMEGGQGVLVSLWVSLMMGWPIQWFIFDIIWDLIKTFFCVFLQATCSKVKVRRKSPIHFEKHWIGSQRG